MKTLTILAALIVAVDISIAAQAAPPRLVKQGSTQQLIVGGKPFLILGGELGNSSASSADYMRPHWPRLKAMHLNTVLAPVSWELIEPAEGKPGRLLNGDQTHQGRHIRLPPGQFQIQKVRLYRYR